VNCPFCDSTALRRSRFQALDVVHLLLLRVPVRCRRCQERSYVRLGAARQIKLASKVRRAAASLRSDSHPSD
jgi:hypothetical protein